MNSIKSNGRTILGTFREYTQSDFHHSPFIVFWETTQACDLVCKHCRASAQPNRHPEEIQGDLCIELIQQLAQFPYKPTLILTGGDPMKREDVFDIIRWGTDAGLSMAMTPSVTPLLTDEVLYQLKKAGLKRIAFSLDGADSSTHDGIRGISGSFERTIQMIKSANRNGIPIQINTTISKRNFHQVNEIADFISHLNITLWSV
ncbi:MAG: radical SAM protein, partial [candidate division WOR-3 bacterium]